VSAAGRKNWPVRQRSWVLSDHPLVPFMNLSQQEREGIIIKALTSRPDQPFAQICDDIGITEEEYLDTVKSSTTMTRDLIETAVELIVTPGIPGALHTLMHRARKGDTMHMKMLLTMIKALEPDRGDDDGIYTNYSSEELRQELNRLNNEIGDS